MSQVGRQNKLTIVGPKGIQKLIKTISELSYMYLSFEIVFNELEDQSNSSELYVHKGLSISYFPVDHRIPCYGFKFEEQIGSFNIRKEAINEFNLSIEEIRSIKSGQKIYRDGVPLDHSLLVHPKAIARSYAYCADTRYHENILSHITGCNTIYHESTYLEELKEQATERGHSTAKEAARIANKANVKTLILGHYSSRYKDLEQFRLEASEEFENVIIGYDGLIHLIN